MPPCPSVQPNWDILYLGVWLRDHLLFICFPMQYDVIIAGGGMAGLSMLWQIRKAGLNHLHILLIDKAQKNQNDRTWCFWESGEGPFEHIIHRKWDHVRVHGAIHQFKDFALNDYRYKMIRGIDFYQFMDDQIDQDIACGRVLTTIQHIEADDNGCTVQTDHGSFYAKTVFDSTYRLPLNTPGRHHLLQHFLGYIIQTSKPVFDVRLPDLMHFGIPQHDQCRFIYVLPLAPDKALIEFTVFSENLLSREAYEEALHGYIQLRVGHVDWTVTETEFGVIPMSDEPVKEFIHPRHIRIGTSGGYTNPATGYTFRSTQKRLADLVQAYVKTGSWFAPISPWQKRFGLYASVMLNVLQHNRVPAPEMFFDLYARNPIDRVFRFLDGESTFMEEVTLMRSMAVKPFAQAALDVVRKRIGF